jgi:hypothetical protein
MSLGRPSSCRDTSTHVLANTRVWGCGPGSDRTCHAGRSIQSLLAEDWSAGGVRDRTEANPTVPLWSVEPGVTRDSHVLSRTLLQELMGVLPGRQTSVSVPTTTRSSDRSRSSHVPFVATPASSPADASALRCTVATATKPPPAGGLR